MLPAYLETRTRIIALTRDRRDRGRLRAGGLRRAARGHLRRLGRRPGRPGRDGRRRHGPAERAARARAPPASCSRPWATCPEFFIGIFALRAGLVDVVRSALVGSILANTLLVLGLAFMAGGLRHGAQKFGSGQTRMMSTLLVLAVAAMAIPTIATLPGGPDHGHETELSVVVSIVLLVVFAASIPFSIGAGAGATSARPPA